MATLADVLRQTGYAQDGTLVAPATDSPMTRALSEHIKTLPQQLATNQAALDSAIGSWNKTDFGTGQPNPNYRPEAIAELTQLMPNIGGLTAWHGTPHKIQGAFDISKVGTGEGAQAYGHGMYFAENPAVAEMYKTVLNKDPENLAKWALDWKEKNPELAKNFIEDLKKSNNNRGTTIADFAQALKNSKYGQKAPSETASLYKVDIPDEHIPNMLDWDKPFAKQTPEVQEALKKMGSEIKFGSNKDSVADFVKLTGNLPPYFQRETGHGIYSELSKQLGGDKQASEYLNSLGIKGTRYLDQQSRGKSGTSNFVVFEPSTVEILEENAKPLTRKEIIEKEFNKK